jgi:methylglutaconyl-CoA hydratase
VEHVRAERDGAVLRVTLARPERRNAFDARVIAELAEAFAAVGDARVVVLGGDGPSFSAGADVDWMRASVGLTHEENLADAERMRSMLEAIDACPAPVVARVQGHAMGGGAGLVAASDIAVASTDAVLAFTETLLGIVPAVISPFVVRRIGHAARRYFVTAERVDAPTACRLGLVDEVAEDLDAAVERVCDGILAGGPDAVRLAKRLATGVLAGPDTSEAIAAQRASAEGQEGLCAFLEKRRPSWRP